MKKTFFVNLLLLLVLNLLIKPFYILGVEAEIQNRVGVQEFGVYFALINMSFLLNIIPDLGTTNWNTRHVAQNAHLLSEQFARIFTLRVVLSGIYLVIIFLVAFLLQYSGEQLIILAILAVSQLFSNMILYLRSNLTGLHLFKQDSLISVLDRAILVVAMGALLIQHHDFRIEWLAWGQCFAYGMTCLIALWLVLRKTEKLHWHWDRPFQMRVLRESLPYATLIVISGFAYRLDSVLLERMAGDAEAGTYAMGFRFYEAVNMIAYLFAVLLLPIFSRMLKHKEDVTPILTLGFQILCAGGLFVALFSSFFSDLILNGIYDIVTDDVRTAFIWLMWSALFFSLQYVFGTLITASGDLKVLIRTAAVGLVVSLFLNLYWIPTEGAVGSAKASAISQGLVLIIQIITVYQRFTLRIAAREYLRLGLFLVGLIGMSFFFASITINDLPTAYSIGIFSGLFVLLAWVSGFLRLHQWMKLIRSREE